MKRRVLFLCTGNSVRSQMAAGLANHDFAGAIAAFSAGTRRVRDDIRARLHELFTAELGLEAKD